VNPGHPAPIEANGTQLFAIDRADPNGSDDLARAFAD